MSKVPKDFVDKSSAWGMKAFKRHPALVPLPLLAAFAMGASFSMLGWVACNRLDVSWFGEQVARHERMEPGQRYNIVQNIEHKELKEVKERHAEIGPHNYRKGTKKE